MEISKILSSSNRRKIFRILRKTNQTNIMNLVYNTRSTYNQVQSDLKTLKKEGIITDKHKGHLRIISLNKENPKTKLLLKALKMLDELQKEVNVQEQKTSFPLRQ